MSTHKNIDRICIVAIVLCFMLTVFFVNGEALGISQAAHTMGYENRLFDTDKLAANNGMPQMGEMPQGGFGGMTPPDGFEGMTPPGGFNGEMPDFGNMEITTDENGNPVMPEGFGGGMPNFGASDNQGTQTEDKSEETEQGTESENSDNAPQNPFGNGGETPDFGGNMQFSQSGRQNSATAYILLGVSALLLAGGLIFAFKFKR